MVATLLPSRAPRRPLALALMLVLLQRPPPAAAYWQEECGGDPAGGWALPDKKPLDCALRQLGLDYATKVLGGRGLAAVHQALRLDICNVSAPPAYAEPPTSRYESLELLLGAAAPTALELFVDPAASADDGSTADGSTDSPYRTIHAARDAVRGIPRPRPPIVVWLRGGTHFLGETGTLLLDEAAGDSGETAKSPIIYASHPNERAVISGGVLLPRLKWQPHAGFAAEGQSAQMYRADLPAGSDFSFIKGLFLLPAASDTHQTATEAPPVVHAVGNRMTRARYPNCDDITGVNCYLLNTSGSTGQPQIPTQPAPHNVNVTNQNGKWMTFGASNLSSTPPVLTVEHSDIAWRCPGDCGWEAFSNWQAQQCYTPEACRFDQTHNTQFWGQGVSGGFYYNATASATAWAPAWTQKAWSNASTGYVHMYHAARWGGWQFKLHSRNDSDHSLQFACNLINTSDYSISEHNVECPKSGEAAVVIGGWQEGRGASISNQYTNPSLNDSYFVENIKEETDAPSEWFFDEAEHALYFIPPLSAKITSASQLDALQLVATKLARVVQFNGTAEAPLRHVHLANVTIAHSAYTYMEQYEIPSGGDWAIHRGASVFADGAESVSISGNSFDQIDGNGIFLSRYARNCSILNNDFSMIGDSAILVVGASGRGMIDNSKNRNYPAYNLIEGNHVATVGVWVKQTAAYFKSVTRENTIRNNVFHDSPRSLVNWNDGMAGGEILEGNMLLNSVKESNDHGPFNSWDRQPYVYRIEEDNMQSKLAVSPQTMTISNNLIYNFNFHGQSCGSIAIDFDDETSQMNVSSNVLVYGAIKTFDGMDRRIWDNLILYAHNTNHMATSCCLAALQAKRNVSSDHTWFHDNHCVLPAEDNSLYECGAGPGPFANASYHIHTWNNHYYFPDQKQLPTSAGWGCNLWEGNPPKPAGPSNWTAWQAAGLDVGSTLSLDFSDTAILAAAKKRLGL